MRINRRRSGTVKARSSQGRSLPPSRLRTDLAGRILHLLKEQGADTGYHLVELDLCRQFGVSRTPVRGALNLLADQGIVEARSNRGFALREPVEAVPELDTRNLEDEEDKQLFVAIAKARNGGELPAHCTQQELMRIFDVKLATVGRVLRRLSELGLVERKRGNGWSFVASINSETAQAESYAFRQIIEPIALLLPGFELDREWARACRARHMVFRRKPWRGTLAVEFYEMNAEFHAQLARCSGNRYLFDCIERQNQVRTFLNYEWPYGVDRVRASVEEHLAILDALEAGENQHAAGLMRSHLDNSKATQDRETQGRARPAAPGHR
ncbi:MAG TPA: GntR family transcriptional regulator [Steroidobacteraceae bacterium]|nr:GntR family transcriptional regulator [Steroidobacteraceae bacterium]